MAAGDSPRPGEVLKRNKYNRHICVPSNSEVAVPRSQTSLAKGGYLNLHPYPPIYGPREHLGQGGRFKMPAWELESSAVTSACYSINEARVWILTRVAPKCL